ncbi:KIF6, partial [Symbiodinium microadriaticum]
FAQRVSLIKNKATVNEGSDPDLVIKRLKNEVLTLREEIAFLKGEAGEGDALTPQATQDLIDKCRQYCDDTDPLCILNIGELTITKIKDAFAVLKNLVLEARQSGGGGGWRQDGKQDVSASEEELQKQVADLKSCLLQRDNEIAILVNMVKKERAGGAGGGGGMNGGVAEEAYQQQRKEEEMAAKAAVTGRGGRENGGRGGAPNPQTNPGIMSAAEREALRSEKIIKKHLYGVPPPDDKTIFDDMQACFEYFRSNCDLKNSIEDNKAILKEKMKEAQQHGEKANQSRNTITYLKNSIESIRRESALQKMSESKDDAEGQEVEMSAEENTYRRAIEQEKAVYRESFEKLRVLKPEIEHIRK